MVARTFLQEIIEIKIVRTENKCSRMPSLKTENTERLRGFIMQKNQSLTIFSDIVNKSQCLLLDHFLFFARKKPKKLN